MVKQPLYILLCGVSYLKIPKPQSLWTVVLRVLKEKDNKQKKVKKAKKI